MTVRSIVEMFESMAASSGAPDAHADSAESPERGNVHGLVTYYDALAVVEEVPIILPTKTVRIVARNQPTINESEEEQEQEEQEEELQDTEQVELVQDKQEEDTHESNQESSNEPAVNPALLSPLKLVRKRSLPLSKIPQPKSREFHLAACSVRKPSIDDTSRSRTSSSSSTDASQTLYVPPPPTPISARVRAPCTSYAAFVARIENSSSRLLDFEKDERWLGQVETMKGRVEVLKRRNQLALVREVASTPRKGRSLSECSAVSTASTASMSSMDTPEISCQ